MGQVGSAMTDPNTFAPDPSGFSGSEWTARILGGAGQGLMQGLGNRKQQPQATQGPMQVPMTPQPQVQLPQGLGPGTGDPNKRNLFYGQ